MTITATYTPSGIDETFIPCSNESVEITVAPLVAITRIDLTSERLPSKYMTSLTGLGVILNPYPTKISLIHRVARNMSVPVEAMDSQSTLQD